MFTPSEIIKGLDCEKCFEIRDRGIRKPDKLYLYVDWSGATRCFCISHMSYFKDAAIKNYDEDWNKVGYGAELMSEILKRLDELSSSHQ